MEAGNLDRQRKNVLIVDDEPKILEVVAAVLRSKGFQVLTAENGRDALTIFQRENISLVILDLMLPELSGEDVCRAIRKQSRVPVIMLTAKVTESELVDGFALGADDYLTKPFSLKELLARVDAVLRRTENDLIPLSVRNSFHNGDLVVDFAQNTLRKSGRVFTLTPSEFKILAALIKYPGKVFTREEMIEIAFQGEFDGYDRVIDTHIKNIRQKIEDDPRKPVYIITAHGLGYKFGGD
ncbi:MAG: response regulator transcription factor [Peptococcaceae bacterium]|jgi:DNA-binding response OmpR family regulator|nr:response regulator transcription factor [Peptococcaceae bacterium]